MDVFAFRENIVTEYERFTRSFSKIATKDIKSFVNRKYDDGLELLRGIRLHYQKKQRTIDFNRGDLS
jgi:hypothetical protein